MTENPSTEPLSHPDFRAVREVELPHLRATAHEFEHLPSGVRLLHLACDDTENCFALAFATPPAADNGVPHILEHAVLAGSERFPVREPFFELVKSSPAGFINAMTSDVWTVYPITTTLESDFWNLAEVYADAVFSPLLTRETFEREGHHLALAEAGNPDAPLIRTGIVYNEMKGAYSSIESVVYSRSQNKLFPGGPLGYDAGGDPRNIPELTWEGLREFYANYYAPGNCLLFLYGDIPTEKHLAYWGDRLKDAQRYPSLAARPDSPLWDAPRSSEESYSVEPGSDLKGKTYLSLRWRCGDGLNRFEEMAWGVLSRSLAGHDSAPLKKALVDAKLGADVLACGVEDAESELTFHVALKGSERDRGEKFEAFTLDTLRAIADAGFGETEIQTALRQAAYETLEVPSLFPLHIAMDAARYSACGADPLDSTRSREMLEKVRDEALSNPDFFPRLIREKLLDNPHRLLVTFYPDPEHAAREVEREKGDLAALRNTLSPEELRDIDQRAQELDAAQDEPNSPESLATLPRLRKGDLPTAPREIPTQVGEVAGYTVLRNDVFSNGVAYLNAAADMRDLPAELWKYVPRYAAAFYKMGVEGQSWEQVAARRAASTGGLSASQRPMVAAGSGAPVVDMGIQLKTLDGDVDDALDLLGDLIFRVDASDKERLQVVQTQGVAAYRDHLINGALETAVSCAARDQTPIGPLRYLWSSPLTLRWMRHLTDNFEANADELIEGITRVRDFLLDTSRWTWSFTGGDAAFARVENRLGEWSGKMGSGTAATTAPNFGNGHWDGGDTLPRVVGLAAPLDVQYCARAFPLPRAEMQSLVELGFRTLAFDYFLPEIRLKGNAYGGGSALNEELGIGQFYSYRDPRLSETLRVFDRARDWAANRDWNADDLERVLLGNVGDAVPAIRPSDSTSRALLRYRRGETAEMRAADYSQKLAATPEAVKAAVLDYLDEAETKGSIAVSASRVALENANKEREAAGQTPLHIVEMVGEGEGE